MYKIVFYRHGLTHSWSLFINNLLSEFKSGRRFCFDSLVVLNVVYDYVLLFLLDMKIENKLK